MLSFHLLVWKVLCPECGSPHVGFYFKPADVLEKGSSDIDWVCESCGHTWYSSHVLPENVKRWLKKRVRCERV